MLEVRLVDLVEKFHTTCAHGVALRYNNFHNISYNVVNNVMLEVFNESKKIENYFYFGFDCGNNIGRTSQNKSKSNFKIFFIQ